MRCIASFFAAILLLPFQIPIVLIGWLFSGIIQFLPVTYHWYAAIWNTGMIGPFLKCVMFVFIVPIEVVIWAVSLAVSPFVVWFAQAASIAMADPNFLSVGVDTVRQYWNWLSVGVPGDLEHYGGSSRNPPLDFNPFVFLFMILFSVLASFALVLPVTAVVAVLAFLPSWAKMISMAVSQGNDPLFAICALLFTPFGAIGLLLLGILWPMFNCLFGVWEAWINGNREASLKYPGKAIEAHWLLLRDFFDSGKLFD